MTFIKNCFKHFHKICKHKRWVFHYCRLAGIPFRGLMHDMSKFGPSEFFGNVRWYGDGTRSPIDNCKDVNGLSYAWQHHKGRNKHHYEYWTDRFDQGGYALPMPDTYLVEMLCDYLGAGIAYNGKKKFTYSNEYEWWKNKQTHCSMHPYNKAFIEACLNWLAFLEEYNTTITPAVMKTVIKDGFNYAKKMVPQKTPVPFLESLNVNFNYITNSN